MTTAEYHALPISRFARLKVTPRRYVVVQIDGTSRFADNAWREPNVTVLTPPLPRTEAEIILRDHQRREALDNSYKGCA